MHRDRRASTYLLVIYGVLALGALGAPMSGPVQAFKGVLMYIVNPALFMGAHAQEYISRMPLRVGRMISTDIENNDLREQAKKIPQLEGEVDSLRRENDRLREELHFKPAGLRVNRWARVMERDPLNWYRYLVIDAGADDGVVVDSPALGLSSGTLAAIGRVTEAGPHWAKVLLLTDDVSAVAAYIPDKSWEGLVEGQGAGPLRMNYLPMQASIAVGDPVRTSATSATFPPDILIGAVAKVFQQDPFLTFQSVGVIPAVDAGKLQEVLILVPRRREEAP